jgi:hypothetical protein
MLREQDTNEKPTFCSVRQTTAYICCCRQPKQRRLMSTFVFLLSDLLRIYDLDQITRTQRHEPFIFDVPSSFTQKKLCPPSRRCKNTPCTLILDHFYILTYRYILSFVSATILEPFVKKNAESNFCRHSRG